MSYQIQSKDERKELISLMTEIFGIDRKKLSKRTNQELLNKLAKAGLHPDEAEKDLVEMIANYTYQSTYTTAIPLLIDHYIAKCKQWTVRHTPTDTDPVTGPEMTKPDNGLVKEIRTSRSPTTPSRLIREMVSAGTFTLDEVFSSAETLGFDLKTIRRRLTKFRSTKYGPQEGVVAIRGDGKLQWI